MKHKHYEMIVAWAEGKQIQIQDIDGMWSDMQYPAWGLGSEYRIKPEPRPQWQQDLIDAAKAGKVVEIKSIDEWVLSSVNTYFDKNDFGDGEQEHYRIRPEKVTRYLWAYKSPLNSWCATWVFKTEQEASESYEDIEHMRLDYTATEFEE